MDIIETKKVLSLDDGEIRELNEAYLVLNDIWSELREECNDIIVDGEEYSCLDIKRTMRLIDDIAEASDIKVVKGEKYEYN